MSVSLQVAILVEISLAAAPFTSPLLLVWNTMRILLCSCALLTLLTPGSPRLLHSLPEDTYAFPKFRVSFLNGLPVLNETAERWLREGLRGGELEFLDRPWKQDSFHFQEIGSGDEYEGVLRSEVRTLQFCGSSGQLRPHSSPRLRPFLLYQRASSPLNI